MKQENSYLMKICNVYDCEEAVELKLNQIHPKLFGLFCPMKYQLVSTEKVYVPYILLILDYRLVRSSRKKSSDKPGLMDRSGQIGIIYDKNEVHVFHYDLFDELKLVKGRKSDMDGRLIKPKMTDEDSSYQFI